MLFFPMLYTWYSLRMQNDTWPRNLLLIKNPQFLPKYYGNTQRHKGAGEGLRTYYVFGAPPLWRELKFDRGLSNKKMAAAAKNILGHFFIRSFV